MLDMRARASIATVESFAGRPRAIPPTDTPSHSMAVLTGVNMQKTDFVFDYSQSEIERLNANPRCRVQSLSDYCTALE